MLWQMGTLEVQRMERSIREIERRGFLVPGTLMWEGELGLKATEWEAMDCFGAVVKPEVVDLDDEEAQSLVDEIA